MAVTDRCDTCRYYVEEKGAPSGQCRRYPPPYQAVVGDQDWCGEWKPAVVLTELPA